MAYGKPVWGVDIGQRALKALRLRMGPNGPELLNIEIVEHPKILSQPDADEEQLIRDALEKFASKNVTRGERVVVSVPGQAAFIRFIKLPPVERKKIPEIVRYEARQQIPFAIEDVLWDYQPVGSQPTGLETEIGLFAMKKDVINDFVSNFVVARIEVEMVQIAPLALFNFLVQDGQIGQGATVYLDMGAENTNLIITDGNRIWLRNIPLGGNNFTRAISKVRKLTFANAELEKRTLRQRKDAKEILEAMQPVFAEVLAEVQRSMGYFTSLHRDVRIERILGAGGAFRTPGLRRFLAQNLQYRVDELGAFKKLGESALLKTPEAQEHLPGLAVAYGLALQGLEAAPLYTNLLPAEIRRARLIRQKRPAAAAVVAILAAAVGLAAIGGAIEQSRARSLSGKERVSRLDQEIRGYETALARANDRVYGARAQIAPLTRTIEGRGMMLALLNELMRVLPTDSPSVRIESFSRVAELQRAVWVWDKPENPRPETVGLLKDRRIADEPVWMMQLSGYSRSPTAQRFLQDVVFRRIEESPVFTQYFLDGAGLRTRQVSRAVQGADGLVRVEQQEVQEYFFNIRFFVVVSRLKNVAEGRPAVAATPGAPPP